MQKKLFSERYRQRHNLTLKNKTMKNLALNGLAITVFSIAATLFIFTIINILKLI